MTYFPQLLQGTWVTIQVALLALLLGMFVGLLGAAAESSRFKFMVFITKSLTILLRGLPEILVLFLVFYGGTYALMILSGHYIEVSTFTAGALALGLIFGAYATQIFRGAFRAVPQGQRDVARAMGMGDLQIAWRIVLPQAWRHALPGLGNLWLVLLKDTALVSLIGLADLMNRADVAARNTQYYFEFYLMAAGIYLILTFISQQVIEYFSRRANRHLERAS